MYHGLKFGPDGTCVEARDRKRYLLSSRFERTPQSSATVFVWIWMGEKNRADPAQILDCFWNDHPDWRMKPGYLRYQANYQLIVDNLLDFSHLPFLHPTTLGQLRKRKR